MYIYAQYYRDRYFSSQKKKKKKKKKHKIEKKIKLVNGYVEIKRCFKWEKK